MIAPCTCSACKCRICGARCTEECAGHDYDPGDATTPRAPQDTIPCPPPSGMLGPDTFPDDAPPDSLYRATSQVLS
jgi:hypothetical protein